MKRDRGSRCLCALTPSGSFPRTRVIVSRGVGRLRAAATVVRERGELCADLRRILLISLQVGARDLAMGTWKNDHFFPLTSLQIGDLQSYLSRLTLFLAPESNKLFILVDNRPWLTDLDTRPAHLWQLMVTKSRLSPFANTRGGRKSKDFGRRFNLGNSSSEIKDTGQKLDFRNGSRSTLKGRRLYRWFSLIDAALYQEKAMLPVRKLKNSFLLNKELHHTLYGFIVFEVAWAHVRGINYLNELQTDTSMALETKLMKRSLLSVLSKPFIGPVMELVDFILPFWNVCLETVESLSSLLFILFGSTCSMALGIVQVILWPFWFIFTVIWSIATSVIYPVIWVFWEILVAPFRLVLSIANVITMIFSHTYYFLRETWSSIGFMFQFGTASEAALGAYEPSMWRSLWNDLFSQVFRAVRSILYGFVAFFTTCNRHRLSIYNHIQEFLLHLSHASRRSSSAKFTDGCQIRPKNPLGERQKHSTKCALQSQDRLHRRSRKKDKGGRTEEDYKLKSP
ncbi:hypothetical protein J5N97_004914 [Dioscorea zingiberensis]|uniref:Uncharacterized protein n=1 Tax=Dioscorea zingiberensis TaxID=325984 RepID=A0A9D5D9A4_9LILI|nr:hypothetical protein J5N97_004914 [Dioscorea zingiberensis]